MKESCLFFMFLAPAGERSMKESCLLFMFLAAARERG
jgi:hypothetical protein